MRAVVIVSALVFIAGCDTGQPEQAQAAAAPPPPPVDVATPIAQPVVDWDEYTGRFEAVERVEVRARVPGFVESVNFRDGQMVEKGDLLFVIDRRPYEAQAARARGELASARSSLDLARAELARADRLLKSRAISREDFDVRNANKKAADAGLAAAEAAVRSAELDVEFTRVVAPIAGRISDRKVDAGNLVSGGTDQATLLATIVSLDPIYFVFDSSEADFLRYVRMARSGKRASSRDAENPVFVRLMDETEWTREGKMNFVDNELASRAGTIRGRAVFDNPDLFLAPGVFGRARLFGSLEYDGILIPDAAIVSDQSTKLVMTVGPQDVVVPKVVELGPIVDGLRVVRSGLEPNARVIIGGIQRARPGQPVTPQPAEIVRDGVQAAGASD